MGHFDAVVRRKRFVLSSEKEKKTPPYSKVDEKKTLSLPASSPVPRRRPLERIEFEGDDDDDEDEKKKKKKKKKKRKKKKKKKKRERKKMKSFGESKALERGKREERTLRREIPRIQISVGWKSTIGSTR